MKNWGSACSTGQQETPHISLSSPAACLSCCRSFAISNTSVLFNYYLCQPILRYFCRYKGIEKARILKSLPDFLPMSDFPSGLSGNFRYGFYLIFPRFYPRWESCFFHDIDIGAVTPSQFRCVVQVTEQPGIVC